jgi:hypothetical protein
LVEEIKHAVQNISLVIFILKSTRLLDDMCTGSKLF